MVMAPAEDDEAVVLLLDASVDESFEQADVPMIASVARPTAAIALRLAEFMGIPHSNVSWDDACRPPRR
jgi:hypothetical protein